MLGQRYSTSKLTSSLANKRWPNQMLLLSQQQLGFVWRMVSMLAGWYPDRIPQDQIPQYEKWTKSHSMKGGENKCQQLGGYQWQCVHIAQHMKSIVWFEVNRLPWNNIVTYVTRNGVGLVVGGYGYG